MTEIVVIKYPSKSSPLNFFYRGNMIVMVGIPHRTSIFKCWPDEASVGSRFSLLGAITQVPFNKIQSAGCFGCDAINMWNKGHCLVKYYTQIWMLLDTL